MVSTCLLILAAACISSPAEPQEQQGSSGGSSNGDLVVSPATVWLWPGDSRQLGAQVFEDGLAVDGVSFSWSSSNPNVVDVDANGKVHGKGTGSAKIQATGKGRNGSATVTVVSDEKEAALAAIFGLPRLESVWPSLAYSPRYDELFEKHGDEHFARTGGQWEFTYYDRGLAWYAAWWRTGNPEYIERGHADVLDYRDDYVLANDGRATPKWVFSEGLAIHHLLTGDPKSLEAIVKMADHMNHAGWIDNTMETRYRDGRIQGRAVLVQIIASLLTGDARFQDRAARGVDNMVAWYESSGSNGSWDHPTRTDISYCGGMATFQIAHAILEALIRYHDLIEPDPRVVPIVEAALDYSWNFWEPGEGFAYIQPPETWLATHDLATDVFSCEGSGSSQPSKDVSLLIATTFAEAYRLTGEERFLTRGDEVLEYGLSGAIFMNGYKQFNQSFMRSYRYLYFTN